MDIQEAGVQGVQQAMQKAGKIAKDVIQKAIQTGKMAIEGGSHLAQSTGQQAGGAQQGWGRRM